MAKVICDHLEPFYAFTEMFSGTRYPTANLFFPVVCKLRLSLNEWLTSTCSAIRCMASQMLAKFEKYWDSIHGFLAVAIVFDPRFKMQMVRYFYRMIYVHDYQIEIEKVRNLCEELMSEYQQKVGTEATVDTNDNLTVPSSSSSKPKFGMVNFDDFDKFVNEETVDTQCKSELEVYLEEPIAERIPDFDILCWWRMKRGKYPILSKIVRDILAVPVSTVASESAFSTSGRVLTPHRNRLHPETLEKLMCAQSWLWEPLRGNINFSIIFCFIYLLFIQFIFKI